MSIVETSAISGELPVPTSVLLMSTSGRLIWTCQQRVAAGDPSRPWSPWSDPGPRPPSHPAREPLRDLLQESAAAVGSLNHAYLASERSRGPGAPLGAGAVGKRYAPCVPQAAALGGGEHGFWEVAVR